MVKSPQICLLTPCFPPEAGGVARASARRAADLTDSQSLHSVVTPAYVTRKSSNEILIQDPNTDLYSQGIDLIHAYYPSRTYPWAQRLQSERQIPLLYSARGNDIDRDLWLPDLRPALLQALSQAQALTGVSRELQRRLQALMPHTPCFYVPNSVDAELFSPLPPKPRPAHWQANASFVIAFAGEARLKKGWPILLQAFARLYPKYPQLRLLIIGQVRAGESAELLKIWQAQNPAAAQAMILHDYVEHAALSQLYNWADCLIQPSYEDGMANVCLEGMACGLPVIATQVGGFPDMLADNAGVLIPPYSVEALEAAIVGLIDYPERALQLGHAARQSIIENFLARHERAAWQQVYAQALSAANESETVARPG